MSEDYISRNDVLKKLEFYLDDCAKTSKYTRMGFETAIEVVKGTPGVQSIRPKGKWIKVSAELIRFGLRPTFCICDICGEVGNKTDFCPNCGADMRGTNND